MNKRKTLSLVLSLLMLVPGTAYAKENKNTPGKQTNAPQMLELKNEKVQEQKKTAEDQSKAKQEIIEIKSLDSAAEKSKGQEHKLETQQSKDEKKAQIETFKTAMKAKHEQMKSLRQETIVLRKKVEQKTEQLVAILSDLQSGKKTLSEDMLNNLLAASENLKIDEKAIEETAGMSTEAKDTQARVKGADFNNALASMDKVIAKYQKRLAALKQLNADLDTALGIANQAVAPAPVDDTTPVPAPVETSPVSEVTTPADTATATSQTESLKAAADNQTTSVDVSDTTSDTASGEVTSN